MQQHSHSQQSLKRDRTASPPLRGHTRRTLNRSPPLSPESPRTSAQLTTAERLTCDPALAALLHDGSFDARSSSGALLFDDGLVAGTAAYARMQTLQDVLRRTSLTEFRDREIAEWLEEMETWLLQIKAPAVTRDAAGIGGGQLSSSSSSAAPFANGGGDRRADAGRGAMSAEVRFAILGVLDTLPWWRLIEGFADGGPHGAASEPSAAGGHPDNPSHAEALQSRLRTVPHAFVRWHEKIQLSFERVCLALIDQSPRAVQGVLEVLTRPFHALPPVRDGAERSMPCDSVIRVLSQVAARYPASFVLDTLEQSMGTLLPKQRWPDRRHHVACVTILLHLALEAHVPLYTPQLGNQQSFAQVRERFFSTASRSRHRHRRLRGVSGAGGGGGGGDGFQLPPHTAPTSEDSSTDASTTSTGTSGAVSRGGRLDAMPSGYRSTSGVFVESGIRLPPRSLAGFLSSAASHGSAVGGENSTGAGSSDAEPGPAGAISPKLPSENPHNNKMLAYRNDIIRYLLRHLLSMELTLERTVEATPFEEHWWLLNRAGSPLTRHRGAGTDAGPHGLWSPPSASSPGHSFVDGEGPDRAGRRHAALGFPASPYSHAGLDDKAASRGGFSRRDGGDDTYDVKAASLACARLESQFIPSAKPFFKILLDCTTIVFEKLSVDLRRQQAAGACGNADWWRELIVFHTHATLRSQQPVCLLYLAPSLALRGVGGEAADMIHKLISVVTKGVVPPQLQIAPRGHGRASSAAFAASGSGSGGDGGAQPVRMRMAPPSAAGGLHAVPLDQRLRAAQFIFPLFRFLRARLDGEEEGLRRRLLKWMAQEMRKSVVTNHRAVGVASRRGSLAEPGVTTSSTTMQLVEVVFAQCAAISEHLNVDMVATSAASTPKDRPRGETAAAGPGTPRHSVDATTSAAAADAVTEALQPLLFKYTLHGHHHASASDDDATATAAHQDDTSPPGRQLHLDLHQLELEGLLAPNLMSSCPWPLTEIS